MDLKTALNSNISTTSASSLVAPRGFGRPSHLPRRFSFAFLAIPFSFTSAEFPLVHAQNRNSASQPILKPTLVEEVSVDDEEENEDDDVDFEDEALMEEEEDDDYFEDEYEEANVEVYAGDGGEGGGISLAGTWWDKEVLTMAEEVSQIFNGELEIYAFKTLLNSAIQVRIERLTNKSGSPSMEDIEAFSTRYRERLDKAELAKSVPENITLEVSSPGVERVVRVPEELDRFKERALFVKYRKEEGATGLNSESDGVLRLVSLDMEAKWCSWGIADVKMNREKAGKGRPLSKKQRDWRLNTPFDSLLLVRLYSDI